MLNYIFLYMYVNFFYGEVNGGVIKLIYIVENIVLWCIWILIGIYFFWDVNIKYINCLFWGL